MTSGDLLCILHRGIKPLFSMEHYESFLFNAKGKREIRQKKHQKYLQERDATQEKQPMTEGNSFWGVVNCTHWLPIICYVSYLELRLVLKLWRVYAGEGGCPSELLVAQIQGKLEIRPSDSLHSFSTKRNSR